jgi:hypothetical protein
MCLMLIPILRYEKRFQIHCFLIIIYHIGPYRKFSYRAKSTLGGYYASVLYVQANYVDYVVYNSCVFIQI